MPDTPLWITESDVVSLMDMADAIDALERGLLSEARGDAQNMTKTHVAWPVHGHQATLHAIGAAFVKDGVVGTKTWSHTPGGATPLLVLFDAGTGALRAIVEAFAMGQLRTAAASGVATRWLAPSGADTLAIVGTGKQAMTQVAAVSAVRPLRDVRVFSPTESHRREFAAKIEQELGIQARAAASVQDAVRDAPIVTAVTRATEPFLVASMLARGAHVNAVGAIVPTGAEIARDVLSRAGRIVVDSPPQARRLSRELIEYCGNDEGAWAAIEPLSAVVANAGRVKPDSIGDLSVFKSLGMGISDLSLGIELVRRAAAAGLGRPIETPKRAVPRLRPRVVN
jgi:ornithine cyclodeaminase